jgi:hypothetical protein
MNPSSWDATMGNEFKEEEERRATALSPHAHPPLALSPTMEIPVGAAWKISGERSSSDSWRWGLPHWKFPASVAWKFSGGCTSSDRWLGGLLHWKFQVAAWNFLGGHSTHQVCLPHWKF